MPTVDSSWPYRGLIAHRGAGHHAPENTLAAMRAGMRHGFTMVEYDVKLTRDGVAVLLHDDDVRRTSNGTGNAGEKTLAELAELDFGAWHSERYAGEPIATLYSIAAFTQANGMRSNIEIKPHYGAEARTGAELARLASRLWAKAAVPPLLSSFSEAALEAARDAAPDLPRALLISEELPSDWEVRLTRLGCRGLNMNNRYITRSIVHSVHDAGHHIAVWTVNHPQRARELVDWGCDALFTDEIVSISPATIAIEEGS
jgi:glycerophosphoryl diester phosphodiesterase